MITQKLAIGVLCLINIVGSMVISKCWTLLAAYLIVNATQGPNDFMRTELFSQMEKEFVELCPKVDICNRNASEPNVLPNELIGIGNQVSCCQGCSCHERCHENINCCFPNDDNNSSDVGNNISPMECLYVQTGIPDKTWPGNVPAYRIVSSAPKHGCIRDGVLPSCDEDPVAVWGNLSPVYSKDHEKIYKNARCALCHNTTEIIHSLPELVCNERLSRGPIPNSQHAQFLEENLRMSNCYIVFRFRDLSPLANKRCYHELVSTCELPLQIPGMAYTNLSSSDIRKACKSGPKTPFRHDSTVYRNIYCYVCNINTWSMYQSAACTLVEKQRTSVTGKFAVLLDAEYFEKMKHNGVSYEKISLPEACVRNGPAMTSERCRDILCPSGQIRTHAGCKVPSKSWLVGTVSLSVQLNYPDSEYDNTTTQFHQGLVKQTAVKERFLENKPWPSLWKLMLIRHIEELHPERSVLITLVSNSNSPEILFRSIKKSIEKKWTVNLNESSVNFEQSIAKSTSNTDWNFKLLYYDRRLTTFRGLTKLFVCEQVSLYSGEFNLTERNTVLISNLTVRNLFQMEFALVYDSDTIESVMVCLSDTLFKYMHATNGSQMELLALSKILLVLALSKILLVLAFYQLI